MSQVITPNAPLVEAPADLGAPAAAPAVQPQEAAPADPPSGEVATTEPAAPESLTLTQDAFKERLTQAKRSASKSLLGELGFESVEQLQEWRSSADAAIKAEKERNRSKMSEIERLKEDFEAEKAARMADQAARAEAEKQAEALRVQNHLHGLFVSRGIKNTDYALFKVEQALSQLDDGQDLDEVAFIDSLASNDMEKAALGLMTVAPQAAPEQIAAQTAPSRLGPDPAPNAAEDDFDAMKASPEEMEKRLRALGFHG